MKFSPKSSIALVGLLSAILTIASSSFATESCVSGNWIGQIFFTSTQATIELQISNEAGNPTGKLILPGQNNEGLPLENLKINGSDVSFEIDNGRAIAAFKGVLNPDGKGIKGDFVQAGQTFAFELNRKMGDLTIKTPTAGMDVPKQ